MMLYHHLGMHVGRRSVRSFGVGCPVWCGVMSVLFLLVKLKDGHAKYLCYTVDKGSRVESKVHIAPNKGAIVEQTKPIHVVSVFSARLAVRYDQHLAAAVVAPPSLTHLRMFGGVDFYGKTTPEDVRPFIRSQRPGYQARNFLTGRHHKSHDYLAMLSRWPPSGGLRVLLMPDSTALTYTPEMLLRNLNTKLSVKRQLESALWLSGAGEGELHIAPLPRYPPSFRIRPEFTLSFPAFAPSALPKGYGLVWIRPMVASDLRAGGGRSVVAVSLVYANPIDRKCVCVDSFRGNQRGLRIGNPPDQWCRLMKEITERRTLNNTMVLVRGYGGVSRETLLQIGKGLTKIE